PPLAVGTKPLAYFLKFHFQRENAKPDRHSQRDGRKLKPNGSLLSRALNTLTLCRVPNTRENLLARVRQRSRLRNRFIGPSQVISNSRLVCCPSFRISRRGDSRLVTFSTIAPSQRSTRCANLPRWAD